MINARKNVIENGLMTLIKHIGDDPYREGLIDTPKRVMESLKEMCSGYQLNPEDVLKTFEDGAESYDEMVVLKDIEFTSICEHHMLPFTGKAHVAYIPKDRIVGLSKLARLVDVFSRRLQVQERLTTQITEALEKLLSPDCACVIEAHHQCMSCRGVKKHRAIMITSSLKGAFQRDSQTRSEFLSIIKD